MVRVGDLTVDMGDTALPPGETHVDVDLGFGDLTIYVPHGVAVEIEGRATFGHVVVLGRVDEGYDSDNRVVEPGSTASRPWSSMPRSERATSR